MTDQIPRTHSQEEVCVHTFSFSYGSLVRGKWAKRWEERRKTKRGPLLRCIKSPTSSEQPVSRVKRNSLGEWKEIPRGTPGSNYEGLEMGQESSQAIQTSNYQSMKTQQAGWDKILWGILDLYGKKGSFPPKVRGWAARPKEISKHRRRKLDWRTK